MVQENEQKFWLWVARPEYYEDNEFLEPGQDDYDDSTWSCHRETKKGDLVLMWRTSPKKDIGYLIRAESDAESDPQWGYVCEYKPLYKFENPVTIKDLNENSDFHDWGPYRAHFQGKSFNIPLRQWETLNFIASKKNPGYRAILEKCWKSPDKPSATLPEIIQDIQSVLERKGQVILYGPPGTGKTYWAERAAREMASLDRYGKSFDRLSDEQKRGLIDGGDDSGAVRICCFHPAYGYEDFLEGYRPEEADGKMSFVLRDGIFKKLCKDALSNPGAKFYLIIDEINRGDIPRIFGELMTVLEKNKRGKTIILPVSGEQMQVPENVRVIGTMNTADRSIALLDTALRRRFGFIEVMPDASVLGDSVVGGVHLGEWLSALNRRICESVGRDARNRQIGHSYLMEDGKPISNLSSFSRVVQDEIIPLLEEYCYEEYSKIEKILGGEVVDVQRQMIRCEIFEGSSDGEFVRAMSKISKDGSSRPSVMGPDAPEDVVSDSEEAPEEERTDG